MFLRPTLRRLAGWACVCWSLYLPVWAQAPAASPPPLKILTAGAFKQVVVALLPLLQAQTGVPITVDNDTAGGLAKRVRGGEAFDVLVLPPGSLAPLGQEGWVDAASTRNIARVGIGVAVRSGAAHPEMATVDQFKAAVLRAHKVAYIDPAAGGSSGIYLHGLFERLGVAAEVQAKAVLVPGGLVAERLVTGEADLAIHQVSEILPVPGVDLVGTLPPEIQNTTTYAAAVSVKSSQAAAARQVLQALAAPEAAAIIRAKGMNPVP